MNFRFLTIAALAATMFPVPALMAQEQQELPDSLSSQYDDLDELVVVAKKDIIKSDGANLTYDMSGDASSKGQTLLDALRKVPLVTVDGQDNVYIKGNSNFKVYTNGKEDPMLTANYKTVFKAMPASSVVKIEVITEPGAKYDAEGTGGILNLVTETKQTRDGYAGSASLSASNQNLSASLYGRMKQNEVTADVNATYATSIFGCSENLQHSTQVNTRDDNNYLQNSHMVQKFGFQFANGALNLSWEPSANDLISAGADISWTDMKSGDMKITNSMFNRSGSMLWSVFQDGNAKVNNLDASGNLAYRHNFGRPENSLSFAYRFNFGKSHMGVNYLNSVLEGDIFRAPYERSDADDYQRQHTVNADYENQFGGKHTLQAGVKGIFRRNTGLNTSLAGLDEENLFPTDAADGHITQVQDVYAVYAAYRAIFGNISANAGLRYEHTHMGLDFRDPSFTNFRRDLDDVVPDAAVAYMFGPANSLRLAYQMRIWRPSANQMNPAVFKITDTYAQVGNPDLESEHFNSVSLTYSNFGTLLGGNISATYRQSNNSIESYQYVEDGVNYTTYDNFGTNRTFDLSGFLNWNITQKMSASVSGSLIYTDIKASRRGLQNYGWNGNYNISWNYSGPWRMNYSLYGGQSTGNVNLQGKFHGWNYYGVSIKKSFLKDDALSVTLNAGNFFTKYQVYKSESVMDGYRQTSRNRSRNWNVGLSISWNFGHLKDQVKKADKNLDTDDTKQSGKSGAGMGL